MERLILCGGGHVSLEVARAAEHLDFDVAVIDDREEFANAGRFPHADVYAEPFDLALEKLGCRDTDYFVVLTRGHTFDSQCVSLILRRGVFAYLGMIGSRVKVAAVRKLLREDGFSQEQMDRMYAPVGLDIGAQTPAEIAVSILAQVIQVRAAHGGACSAKPAGHGMLVTIIEKHGSAPRGVGTKMLVMRDGTTEGTVGGGYLEYAATQQALELLEQKQSAFEKEYDLSHAASETGMVCGGRVTLSYTEQ